MGASVVHRPTTLRGILHQTPNLERRPRNPHPEASQGGVREAEVGPAALFPIVPIISIFFGYVHRGLGSQPVIVSIGQHKLRMCTSRSIRVQNRHNRGNRHTKRLAIVRSFSGQFSLTRAESGATHTLLRNSFGVRILLGNMDKPRVPDAASEVCRVNLYRPGLPTQFGPRTWYIGSKHMCTLVCTPLVVRDS